MKQAYRTAAAVMLAAAILIVVVVGVKAGGALIWASTGVPVTEAVNGQRNPRLASDGAGGAVVVWEDFRSGTAYDIYAQRVNSGGQVQWIVNGLAMSVAANDQRYPQIVGDGQQGAIIAWQDRRNGVDYDVFAQRVLSNGEAAWTTNGITVCVASSTQDYVRLVGDAPDGVIVIWEDKRSGSYDIYVQKITANGDTEWTTNGVSLGEAMPFEPHPEAVSDGQGGVIIAWEHSIDLDTYIYAQRVLSDGTPAWASGGITVSLNRGAFPVLASDGAHGAIVTWTAGDVYAQRVVANGALAWGSDGITLNSPGRGENPTLISDGAQGAYIAWQRSNSTFTASGIFAQHVISNGVPAWAIDGASVISATNRHQLPRLVQDGLGDVLVVWQTASDASGTDYSIRGQQLGASGSPHWIGDGVQVISHTVSQMHSDLFSDLAHGALIVWEDQRNGVTDLYAQRIADFTATTWLYLPLIRK